ncbi:MAG: BON domain-containing protein [Pseudomarimonas sp.]
MNNFKKTFLATMIGATLLTSVPVFAHSPAVERTASVIAADAAITTKVKAALLADARTEGFDINVDTMNGHVELRGGADNVDAELAASEIARAVEGVTAVNNELVIAAKGTEARDRANRETTSGEVRETAEDAGDVIDDAWITGKVKAQLLAEESVKGTDINVNTTDNVVTLIGNVPSASVRAEAIRITQATKGVKGVNADKLVVL